MNGEGPQLLRGHDRELPQTLEVLPLVDGVGGLLLPFGSLRGTGSDDLHNEARRNDEFIRAGHAKCNLGQYSRIQSGSKGFDTEIKHSNYLDALDRRVDREDLELLDDDGGDAARAVRRLSVDRLYHSPVRRPCKWLRGCSPQYAKLRRLLLEREKKTQTNQYFEF